MLSIGCRFPGTVLINPDALVDTEFVVLVLMAVVLIFFPSMEPVSTFRTGCIAGS